MRNRTGDDEPGDGESARIDPRTDSAFFETLVENTSEGVLTIDETSTIVYANPAIETILGYSPDELIGESKLELIPERLQGAHLAGLKKYVRTGEKHIDWDGVELPALHREGHEVPVLISLREHEYDGRQLFTGIFRDLSSRKRRQRQFEAVFNNTYQFTGLLEADGTVVEINETALQFGGLNRDDVVGKPLWETHWIETDRATETVRRGVERASEGEFFREQLTIRGQARQAVIDFSIRPISDDDGTVQRLVPEGRDITSLKNRERQLTVLHRVLRHDMRNDLNAVIGFANLLADELEDERHVEYATEVATAAAGLLDLSERAKTLVDTVLESDAERDPVSLVAIMSDATATVQDRYPAATVELHVGEEADVSVDPRLQAAVEELLENAVEHAEIDEPRVSVAVDRSGGAVSLSVADEGPEIDPTQRTLIFEADEITPLRHGSGLGLWLVSWIVAELGGELQYDSHPEGGNVVTVVLPTSGS
ncbi:PAS domain S-box protein [Halobacteria archaeon AArc-dxtr1]|nr:PAS domain S-box protein [Halobacteria archaeon AArc-dxtr1]